MFLYFEASKPALGPTRPPIQWTPKAISPGVKRPMCEVHYSPPYLAKVKNAWSYVTTTHIFFIACADIIVPLPLPLCRREKERFLKLTQK